MVKVEPLIQHLPSNIPYDVIEKSEIITSEQPFPQKPQNEFSSLIRKGHQLRAITPVVFPDLIEESDGFLRPDGPTVEIIVSEPVLKGLFQRYPDEVRQGLIREGFTIWKSPQRLSFSLLLVDNETGCLGAHNNQGNMTGILRSNDDSVVGWLASIFNRYHGRAEEVFIRGKSSMPHSNKTRKIRRVLNLDMIGSGPWRVRVTMGREIIGIVSQNYVTRCSIDGVPPLIPRSDGSGNVPTQYHIS